MVCSVPGYGNIAPRSRYGRIVCIAYALVGIPLMLLCLANLGDALAKMFRFLYTQVCCCGCCRPDTGSSVRSPNDSEPGDATPSTSAGQLSKQGSVHEAWKTQYENKRKSIANPSDMVQLFVEDDDDDEEESGGDIDNEDYNEISVPLTIILSVIGGYIFLGTVIFGVWEGWDPLTAAYFCFITIATIGFGDVVPGFANSQESSGGDVEMLGTAMYMLLGMATLSMCFTLVQDQLVVKSQLMIKKLQTLVKTNQDEGAEETDARSEEEIPVGPVRNLEANEARRKQRAARLKFKWVRRKFSRNKKTKPSAHTTNTEEITADSRAEVNPELSETTEVSPAAAPSRRGGRKTSRVHEQVNGRIANKKHHDRISSRQKSTADQPESHSIESTESIGMADVVMESIIQRRPLPNLEEIQEDQV